jgi:hypothetical protein
VLGAGLHSHIAHFWTFWKSRDTPFYGKLLINNANTLQVEVLTVPCPHINYLLGMAPSQVVFDKIKKEAWLWILAPGANVSVIWCWGSGSCNKQSIYITFLWNLSLINRLGQSFYPISVKINLLGIADTNPGSSVRVVHYLFIFLCDDTDKYLYCLNHILRSGVRNLKEPQHHNNCI